ncbi:MAG TPA: hypothetical protein VNO30_44410 [Kofleriaceae bacterium]|nr:hypothetical protein [Kofleriaceae bacterium]
MQEHEAHRAGEPGDRVGEPILDPRLSMIDVCLEDGMDRMDRMDRMAGMDR